MLESKDNLWMNWDNKSHLICVSTNGFVKKNGDAVMGRGCAREATERIPACAWALGCWIKQKGNIPGILKFANGNRLGILPVKHNWWEEADLGLIKNSVFWLDDASMMADVTIHVPRLGCGNGKLKWDNVRPLMAHLPDSIVVHSF